MFSPREIIFCPINECNLHCEHCYISRSPISRLDIKESIGLLNSSYSESRKDPPPISSNVVSIVPIESIGFSGGEPFLNMPYLVALSQEAVRLGLNFDRIMTNGVAFSTMKDWCTALDTLMLSGYDGRFGLSYDVYHGQSPEAIAHFIQAVTSVYNTGTLVDITSVIAPNEKLQSLFLGQLEALSNILGAKLMPIDKAHSIIEGNGHLIHIDNIERVYPSSNPKGWGATEWGFTDDYCQGPGNVLYVLPSGYITICCGFSNENPALSIGNTGDSYTHLMLNAARSPMVKAVYIDGLGNIGRKDNLPSIPRDICTYCDYLCL